MAEIKIINSTYGGSFLRFVHHRHHLG